MSSDHPYKRQPDRAFWKRSVSGDFDPRAVAATPDGSDYLSASDRVVSAGSCFASNLIPWLERAGVTYLRSHGLPEFFRQFPDNLGYRQFSAAYGNIYTARHLRQLYERALGLFRPKEDRWHEPGRVIDPFRPGLRYPATSDAEFDLLTEQYLSDVRAVFERATVFVFTLGLTEGWESAIDGAVFPACPGTIAGSMDPRRHRFINFTAGQVAEDLLRFIDRLRARNPGVKFIVTVSPVPLVATATDQHVLTASTYSKSVLRVAAQQVCRERGNAYYFPAYELVTGPQAPHDAFAGDRRSVSEEAIATVMGALLADLPLYAPAVAATESISRPNSLSEAIVAAECEESMLDPS